MIVVENNVGNGLSILLYKLFFAITYKLQPYKIVKLEKSIVFVLC